MADLPSRFPLFAAPDPSAGPAATDAHWMRVAIAMARRAEGMTRPNPAVGAVVVAPDGRCVGFGDHLRAGTPHAEVHALRRAGAAARGSTLYVTLEPCSTTGRTPPCTEAILRAGIRRVVIGTLDPNPRHAGRAVPLLRDAGLAVDVGCEEPACRDLLAPFATAIVRHRPYFRLKLGMTLDARLADYAGTSRWITNAASRDAVQALRRRSDAILVGAGTLRADNPSLLPRPSRGRLPWRVVCARDGDLPADARLFTDSAAARTIVAAPEGWHPATAQTLRDRGIAVLALPRDEAAYFAALAAHLHGLGILAVLCEGGGHLAGALLRQRLVDELHLFLAPVVLGDAALPAFAGIRQTLPDAARFRLLSSQALDGDVHLVLAPDPAP